VWCGFFCAVLNFFFFSFLLFLVYEKECCLLCFRPGGHPRGDPRVPPPCQQHLPCKQWECQGSGANERGGGVVQDLKTQIKTSSSPGRQKRWRRWGGGWRGGHEPCHHTGTQKVSLGGGGRGMKPRRSRSRGAARFFLRRRGRGS